MAPSLNILRRFGLALLLAAPTAALAQNPAEQAGPAESGGGAPPWAGDLDTRSLLLGDLGGLRPALDRFGIAFGLSELTESLGNPVGGLRPGASIEGLAQASVGADLSRLIGLDGGLFNVSAYQIHGRGLTPSNIGALNAISTIEANAATRLNELWIQQSFWDGKLDVKIGQQSADLEFITSEYMDVFVNSGFGWPTLPSLDLPAGGPAYPLSAPAVRLRAHPTDTITALVGLFSGSPARLRPGDPQVIDGSGTSFNVSDGYLTLGEVQYALNHGKGDTGLPGTYKLGGWYNSNRFADAFYDQGTTLNPPGVLFGIPKSYRGNWSLYATADQLVYRPKDDEANGLALTARVLGAPSDRNLITLGLQAGLIYKGPFERANDEAGLGIEVAQVSRRVRQGEQAAVIASGIAMPIQSREVVIEATYQAQVKPWWQLQPDLQVIVDPGAGTADPNDPKKRVGTAAVLGLRSIVTF